MMTGSRMDIAASLGTMLGIGWVGGMFVHFLNGTVIFPLVYLYGLGRFLPEEHWLKGLTWGVILWLVAQVVVMPVMGIIKRIIQ
jgi:hypothetical protein